MLFLLPFTLGINTVECRCKLPYSGDKGGKARASCPGVTFMWRELCTKPSLELRLVFVNPLSSERPVQVSDSGSVLLLREAKCSRSCRAMKSSFPGIRWDAGHGKAKTSK